MTNTKTKSKKILLSKNIRLSLSPNEEKEINIEVEKNSDIEIKCILHATKNDIYKLNYKITHKYPRTKSRSVFRIVLEDSATFDFKGLIEVLNGANQSDAYLKVDVLILSQNASANVVPSLEIAENEIKASHGATITKINEDQIFYMMSRGLDKNQCKKEIVKGFLNLL